MQVLEATPATTNVTLDRNASALAYQHTGCNVDQGAGCDFGVLGGGSTGGWGAMHVARTFHDLNH